MKVSSARWAAVLTATGACQPANISDGSADASFRDQSIVLDVSVRDAAPQDVFVDREAIDGRTDADLSAQDPASLRRMLSIRWSAGPELPRGAQEGALAAVGDELVHIGGYCQGVSEPVPEKPDRYPRGFSAQVERSTAGAAWRSAGVHPGVGRQAHAAAQWRDSVIVAGGFNYDAPYSYADVLRFDTASATWSALASLPWPWVDAALVVIGDTLYAVGGADYDAMVFRTSARRDGSISRLGARVLTLDLSQGSSARWVERASLAGTPRFVHAATVVRGQIYVLGGAAYVEGDPVFRSEYCNVVDNWRYDPSADRWERLRDAPMAIGYWPRGRLTFRDRYVVLPGGTARPCVASVDGVRAAYGVSAVEQLASYGVAHNVLVYDTQTDQFGTATSMPFGNVAPSAVLEGATLHIVGGETGRFHYAGRYFANHPDSYLRGEITESSAGTGAFALSFFSLWPDRSLDRAGFVAEGTCDVSRGDVFVIGPDSDPIERRTPCVGGFFRQPLTYVGAAGNRSMALEQLDERGVRARGHGISVYFMR